MVQRKLEFPNRSFFLFGPRQTGKSTWIRSLGLTGAWHVDLLASEHYFRYLRKPSQFALEARAKIDAGIKWIIIDEAQRIPELLNEAHALIESSDARFILSGSSARKLKRGGANMLGGRALLRTMHPFTHDELGKRFDLEETLRFGSLPPLLAMGREEKIDSLRSYVEAYLKEEIQAEGIVRNLGGFARFIEVAGAYSGLILNTSALSREAGLPTRTVHSYFEILEDTMIAFRVPAWERSPRKQLIAHPKFYLFDNGVLNALRRNLAEAPDPATRGVLFEHFFIQEAARILAYARSEARLHYWRTNGGAEVDLIIEKGGRPELAIEIKARATVDGSDARGLSSFASDYPEARRVIACEAPEPYRLGHVEVLPWRDVLRAIEALARPKGVDGADLRDQPRI